jgi:hypothetical protein
MCEEVAKEYDLKAEDVYSALSGEEVINEGEPRQYKGDGSDAMVSKDGDVLVIDAEELEQYMADGWILAENIFSEDEPFATPKGYVPGEPKIITVNEVIPLAGDSIWMDRADQSVDEVYVTEISVRLGDEDDEDDNTISVHVAHDGPYEIYTDSGFEKAISKLISMDVQFSEQGMQDDGDAHLEGYIGTGASDYYDEPDESIANDYDPLDRVKHLAGVKPVIEDDETDDDEEQIDEAQSEAQKAAFQKMLDAKNGKKEETTEETETDDDEDEVSETLDRVKHLAGV